MIDLAMLNDPYLGKLQIATLAAKVGDIVLLITWKLKEEPPPPPPASVTFEVDPRPPGLGPLSRPLKIIIGFGDYATGDFS